MTDPAGAAGEGIRYAWLADALANDALVLTASRRLARDLRAQHDAEQQRAGRTAWRTPAILFWQDWLARALQESAAESRLLADSHLSAVLWEAQLEGVLDQPVLVQAGLVRQAQVAWQRLLEWNVPLDRLDRQARRPEERAFARAASAYREELTQRGWLDSAQLAAWATQACDRLEVPALILHAGFDRLSPALQGLFAALGDTGAAVRRAAVRPAAREVIVHDCADTDSEFRAAGSWARRIVEQDPGARIAVVTTDLESQPLEYARLLREGLVPGWQRGDQEHRHAVNVSFGRRLVDYPAIAIGLLWLRWLSRDLFAPDVSLLMRSSFIGRGELGGRTRLELALRQLPDRAWSPDALVSWAATREPDGDALDWIEAVGRLADLRREMPAHAAPAQWAERTDRMLRDIGWPGAGSLSSDDFQLVNRWRQLLNELAALGRVAPRLAAAEAVARLGRMAAETLYQPEAGPAYVSLMGILEAAGLEFDHVWVTGMDSGRWPPTAHPLTLVPTRLQRDYGMPDSSPADTLAFARRVMQRLAASAPEVRFSWPRNSGDTPQTASRLLHELPVRAEPSPPDPGWYASSLLALARPTVAADDWVPAVGVGEKVAGGAYTVQRQLAEPFAAFAAGRLGVSEISPFEPGIVPSLRGTITHDALDALYADRPVQADVLAWDDAELRQRAAAAADLGLRRHFVHADPVLRRLLSLEEARVQRILRHFLAFERARLPFAVAEVERRIDFTHAGVRLGLRADRLDRLPDGRLLVIDYKTGALKPLVGSDGDPAEFQLVVYALALGVDVAGLALFYLKSSGVDVRAAGDCEWDKRPGEVWPERIGRWKAIALGAIEAIAAGDARINLKLDSEQGRPLNVLSRAEEARRDQ